MFFTFKIFNNKITVGQKNIAIFHHLYSQILLKKVFFVNFPVDINISKVLENSETPRFCIQVACVNGGSKIFQKPKFSTFGVFPK